MKMIHISIGTKDTSVMNNALKQVRSEGFDVDLRCYDASDLDEDPIKLGDVLEKIASADMVTLKVHGDTTYFKRFDRLEKTVKDYGICTLLDCTDRDVINTYRNLFTGSDEDHTLGITLMEIGGDENLASLIKLALRIDGTNVLVPEPVNPPAQGIYRPGLDDIDIRRYID